jgi:DNA primase
MGASASLAESALLRGTAPTLPRREVLILQTLINHPWLLDDFAEEVAQLQFEANSLHFLRDSILTVHSEQNPLDKEALNKQLNKQGQGSVLAQVEHAITHHSDWNTQPHTSHDDVLIGWRHMLALHRKSVELKRELESAEQAFANEQSEDNYLRLRDLREQILNAEGVQAVIEGYGKVIGA